MTVTTTWRGPQVKAALERAASRALVDVATQCVTTAKSDVPVATAILQRSIRFEPPHKNKVGRISLRWGSFSVHYALAVETGNRSLAGPVPFGRHRVKSVPTRRNEGNTHYLRSAAQRHYPNLARAVRRRFKWLT